MKPIVMNLAAFLREEGAPASARTGTLLLAAVIAAAVAFRLWLMAATDFPINDGALFYEFVRGTAASFPGLPARVDYNGFSLPFAYPPLSFWIGALLTKGGVDGALASSRLGIALALAGRKAEAETAFRSVTGPRAELASLWLLWLNQRG